MSLVQELIDVAGVRELLKTMFSASSIYPTEHQLDDLMKRLETAYEEIYTQEEMKELLEMHKLPIFQKYQESAEAWTNKFTKIGETWAIDNRLA